MILHMEKQLCRLWLGTWLFIRCASLKDRYNVMHVRENNLIDMHRKSVLLMRCICSGVSCKVGFCSCHLDHFETTLLQNWWQKQRNRLQYALASLPAMPTSTWADQLQDHTH